MKKNTKTTNRVLGLVLAISMLLTCFPFAGIAQEAPEALNANISSLETVFVNESGEEVYEAVAGNIRAVSYLESAVEMKVYAGIAVYNQDTLAAVSLVADKLAVGGNVISSKYVPVAAGQSVKAFVWDGDANPLNVANLYGQVAEKSITSATITAGGTAYAANVDRVNKEISVIVPIKYNGDFDNATRISEYNTACEALSSATVSVEGNYASVSPAAEGTYDLLNTQPQLTVTADNGETEVYTVKAEVGDWGRRYNSEGAGLDAGTNTWNTALRKGMPAYISSDYGSGLWLAASGAFFNSSTLEAYTDNTLTISTEGSNDYIHIEKNNTTRSMVFYSTGSLTKNRSYETEFKLRINSLEGSRANTTFMDIWSSNTDKIVLSGDNASEGKFRIAHNKIGGSGSEQEYVPGVELSYGQWYTFKYVYKANSVPESGSEFTDYEMQLYIDGNLVDVFCHGIDNDTQHAGSLTYSSTGTITEFPQVAFNPFIATEIDLDIDDVYVKAVSDYRSFDVSLASATLNLGGNTYTGLINTDRKTITFDVPETEATATNLASATATVTPNDSTVSVDMSSTNLTSAVTVNLTASAGNTDSYTLRIEPSALVRKYDSEGAEIGDNGMPSTIESEGDSVGTWTYSGTKPTVAVCEENSNSYIKVSGTGSDTYFGSNHPSTSTFADKIVCEVDLRFDAIPSGMAADSTMARIRSSHGDFVSLRVVDAAAGKYTLGMAKIDASSDVTIENAPILNVGDWHTLTYVYRRYGTISSVNDTSWYGIEVYIDGEFVAEIQRNAASTVATDSWHYTNSGRFFTGILNYSQFSVNTLSSFTADCSISIDNLNVTYMSDWSPTDSSVLYALNCPVAVVADDSGNEIKYPVTLKANEAVIDIPFTPVSDEYGAINGTDWPEIHPNVTNAVILFPDNMKASLGNSASQSGAVVLNLNNENTLNVSIDGASPAGYTVKTEYSEILANSSSAANVTSSSAYTLSASYVPQDYSCKKMNASSNITLDAFSGTDEAVISLYGRDIAKLTVSDGKIKFSGMSSEFSYSPELEVGDTVRFDCAIRDGNTAEVFADGIYMGSVSINTVSVLPSSNHFAVSCTGSASLTLENTSLSVINSLLDDKTVVHIIGDSMVQYYGHDVKGISKDIEGWGRYICDEFNEDTVVLNHARSGYNTNIYLNGTNRTNYETHERWSSVKSRMKNGDYLIISLAWNEENSVDGTKTEAAYKANMNKIISEAKALGVTPIVCTPHVSMTHWTDSSTGIVKSRINNEKEIWAQYVRDIAEDNSIVCLDLNTALFEDVWKDAYRYDSTGVKNNNQTGWDQANSIYETYSVDGTHVKRVGAQLYKDTLINLLKASNSNLTSLLK